MSIGIVGIKLQYLLRPPIVGNPCRPFRADGFPWLISLQLRLWFPSGILQRRPISEPGTRRLQVAGAVELGLAPAHFSLLASRSSPDVA